MSKKVTVETLHKVKLPDGIKVEVDGKKVTATVTAAHVKTVIGAATEIGKHEPVMINFYQAYRILVEANGVKGDPRMKILDFYHMYDSTIPQEYGDAGSTERKALDSHVMYNRLRRMVETGHKLVLGKKKPVSASARKTARDAKVMKYAGIVKKYKLSASCIREVLAIAKLKTSFVNDVLKKSGFAVAADAA